jgi:DNA polymerase-3 subunit gamma/tau
MAEHVRWVSQDAGLDVSDEAVEHVVTAGGGSVRDTLSALDRVVAAGGVVEADTTTDTLAQAIAGHDMGAALAAVGDATGRGRDPRTIGEDVLAVLRDAFLTTMGAPPPRLSPAQADRAQQLAALMSPAAMTRAMETLGVSLVEMRQAPDPRVDLEVALVRLCRPDSDRSLDALSARVEQLERQLAGGVPTASANPPTSDPAPPVAAAPSLAPEVEPPSSSVAPPVPSTPEPAPTSPPTSAAAGGTGVAAAARRALAEKRGDAPPPAPPPPPATPSAPPPVPGSATPDPPAVRAPEPPPPGPIADAPALAANPDVSLGSLRPRSPSELVQLAGAHLDLDRDTVVRRATELLGPAEGARSEDDLARLWNVLVDEVHPPAATSPTPPPVLDDPIPSPPADDPGPASPDDQSVEPINAEAPPVSTADEDVDLHDLVDAPSHTDEIIERLTEAFPGAELQTKESTEEP